MPPSSGTPTSLTRIAERLRDEVLAGTIERDAAERELGRRAFESLAPLTARPKAPDDVAAVLRALGDLGDPSAWAPAPEYASTAISVIDSIWSIGVRYSGVLNVIARYTALRLEQGADAQTDTPAQLFEFIGGCGGPDGFAAAVMNRQRTSSRNGILKAQAVMEAAELLTEHAVAGPDDLRQMQGTSLDRLARGWRLIRGQGSGLSWDYFLMLNGLEGVKADRMVRRFVARALNRPEDGVSAEEARDLVASAAGTLGVGQRVVDFAIWSAMSG